jgi:hypothetical protein
MIAKHPARKAAPSLIRVEADEVIAEHPAGTGAAGYFPPLSFGEIFGVGAVY